MTVAKDNLKIQENEKKAIDKENISNANKIFAKKRTAN